MSSFDHILLIGFGGPTQPEEVEPFLKNLTHKAPLSKERFAEIIEHYRQIGGKSPYNEQVTTFFNRLKESLFFDGFETPVFLAMRNWKPDLKTAFDLIKKQGFKRGLGIVLAPHRSSISFGRYVLSVKQAAAEAGAKGYQIEYLKPWHDHALFIRAHERMILETLAEQDVKGIANVHLIFCAHAIPLEAARDSCYVEEIESSSRRIARKLECPSWQVAYQSAPRMSKMDWLEPDILSLMRDWQEGPKTAVMIPVGFLCDNKEILYDLDIDACREAELEGIKVVRSKTVLQTPEILEMFTELIKHA
jgi:protoporphyrin/coproporphyrin ferrochelatase